MKTKLKTLTAALALTIGASFASAASADTFSTGAGMKATPVQYNGGYDRDRNDRDRYDRDDTGYRGRDYDRDGDRNRYGRDRDNDRWDRNNSYGRGYNRYRVRAWDWDGDGVPNRYDSRPRNPWRS
jgi:hypothetical protein